MKMTPEEIRKGAPVGRLDTTQMNIFLSAIGEKIMVSGIYGTLKSGAYTHISIIILQD